jgi:AraC-like DNA-binding protein
MPVYQLLHDIAHGPASVRVLLDFASEHGADPARCLHTVGMGGMSPDDPSHEVTLAQELRLLRAVLVEIDDHPGLGLDLGCRYHVTTYGIFGFALISSQTFGDALRIADRFGDLSYALSRVSANRREDEFVWAIDSSNLPDDVARFCTEREIGAAITLVADLLGPSVSPRQTRFAQQSPSELAPFVDRCGPNVIFDAERDEVVFDHAIFALPLPQANPATASMCLAQCQQALDQRQARSGIAGQVRAQLLHDPIRFSDMTVLAASLGFSPRTLRRHLDAEDTTFRHLLAETREVLAEELLRSGLTVEQTAHRLGYHEPASFSHAFRRWKGLWPIDYARPRRAEGDRAQRPGGARHRKPEAR